jgi:pSer/pThr/pTyr-binding forkhead associated (FHA) protein
MPSLRIKLPDNKGEITHVLTGDRITVGRRPDNLIQIIDRSVSGYHAELIGYHGQYRVHDLGSTNLTCVDGQPVTDFHLQKNATVKFGSVECEFTLESASAGEEKPAELVPTKSEMEFLRRENLDLQSKIAAQQKQIDILSSARLMTKETQQLGVAPEAHRRVTEERDQLRTEVSNLRSDLESMMRERDAIRQAWQTVKTELEAAQKELTTLRPSPPPATPDHSDEALGSQHTISSEPAMAEPMAAHSSH